MAEKKNRPSDQANKLRKRAEEKVRERAVRSLKNLEARSPEEVRQMLHELEVHQTGLEMLNEELRQTQEKLEAARARYFDLYDLAPVGYVTLSEQGLILESNLAAAILFGVARGEMIKQPLGRYILPEDNDTCYLHRKQLFETGIPQTCELRMVKKDGTAFWVYLEAAVAQDVDGTPLCRTVMIDITERKEMEKTFTESKDRYKIAIEHSNDGVAIVRGDNHAFVNKRFLEIFGYEQAEEIVGKPVSLTAHPDDRERVLRNNRKRQKKESAPSMYEMKGIKKNGETVYIEVSATNVPFLGKPASLAYLRDVTSRKQREKELEEGIENITQAKQEWESLVDSLSELVLLLDKNGYIVRSNRGIESWNFEHPGDVRGQTPHDVLHPNCTRFDCYLKDFISNGLKDSSVGKPLELEIKDEILKRYLDMRIRPIRNQKSGTNPINGSFAVLVIHDITERMQAKDALAEAYVELKETQQELIQIEKLALLGKFSSGIAHEIRNPLANICASAQFCLAKYKPEEEIKKHLKIMLRNSEHANKIIKDLIDLAKPSEVSLEPGDIGDLISSVCDLVKTRCDKQHILLHKKISRRLPHILMDKERIEKALLNFIINAVEAMPKGGKLAINAYPHFEKGQVIISILDTGKGIPQEDFDNILHPFFTTKRTGIGLGLCLADQVISSHKGMLSINSKVGEGTEITIKLPISRG